MIAAAIVISAVTLAATVVPGVRDFAESVLQQMGLQTSAYASRADGDAKDQRAQSADAAQKPAEGASSAGKNEGGDGKRGGRGEGRGGPVPVSVTEVILTDMPISVQVPGTVEPIEQATIRSRVEGEVVEIGFKEGDDVKAGDVLFRLDDQLARAKVRQAESAIAADQAALTDARSKWKRTQQLAKNRLVSEAAKETSRFSVEQIEANIAASLAQIDMLKTELEFLTIRAPISGRTGIVGTHRGAIVRPGDPIPLVVINQVDPIAVSFSVPQQHVSELRAALRNQLDLKITVPAVEPITLPASLSFVDNAVDVATSSIRAKAIVKNDDLLIWAGQSVMVSVTLAVKPQMLAVPPKAVSPGQTGLLVWVVGKDNKAEPRRIELERLEGGVAYLSSGVSAGDRIVTAGQIRLTPGAEVVIESGETDGAGGKPRDSAADAEGAGKVIEDPAAAAKPAADASDPPAKKG